MRSRTIKIIWAYSIEIILAILLMVLLFTTVGRQKTIDVIQNSAIDFATLYCAVFAAASLGFLWTLYSKVDTKFHVWLDTISAFNVYLNATIYVVFIEAFSTLILLMTKYCKYDWLTTFAGFSFFLALINSYTMIINSTQIMKLQIRFNRIPGNL